MQPALVVSTLALAILLDSSELGRGSEGREKALALRDMAQTYLVTAWNAASTDPALAQAAMVSDGQINVFFVASISPSPISRSVYSQSFPHLSVHVDPGVQRC